MTGQTLLNYMELVDPELQLQVGEIDVVKGLLALNAAQDAFESLLAQHPNIAGSDTGTISLVGNFTETDPYPTNVLRIDRIHFIDPTSGRMIWEVRNIKQTGGQAFNGRVFWPWNLVSNTTGGPPRAYWTNRRKIFWMPIPDLTTYQVRWYGFQSQADITASGTYLYDDHTALPLATLAVKFIKIGLEDPVPDITSLAESTMGPSIRTMQMSRYNQDRAPGYDYQFRNDT